MDYMLLPLPKALYVLVRKHESSRLLRRRLVSAECYCGECYLHQGWLSGNRILVAEEEVVVSMVPPCCTNADEGGLGWVQPSSRGQDT